MRLNTGAVKKLIGARNISQNQLAYRMNISRGSLSNAINGRRGVGRKLLAGLLRVFPHESVSSLIINKFP